MVFTGFFADGKFVEKVYGFSFLDRDCTEEKCFTGVFYGGNGRQLGVQLLAVLVMTVYGAGAAGALFFGMKACKILRVSEEDEIKGLDITHHGGPAYTDDDVAYVAPAKVKAPKEEGESTSS